MESIYGKTMSKPFCEFDQVLISIIASEMEKNGQRSRRSYKKNKLSVSHMWNWYRVFSSPSILSYLNLSTLRKFSAIDTTRFRISAQQTFESKFTEDMAPNRASVSLIGLPLECTPCSLSRLLLVMQVMIAVQIEIGLKSHKKSVLWWHGENECCGTLLFGQILWEDQWTKFTKQVQYD